MRVAAARYLESLDTPEARRRLQAQSADAPLILGARDSFDPKPEFREDWTEWEEGLRERYPNIKWVSYKEFGNTHGGEEREVVASIARKFKELKVDAAISGMGC